MRILKVVHTFLPNYYGGTEVLVSSLAKEMSSKHDVHVFFSNPTAERPDYSVKRKNFDGYTGWEVQKDVRKNIYFEETYIDERVDKAFEKRLDELKPDVVHFHHIIHLSANLPKIAKKHNIPVVFTLHDFWFQCPMIKRVDLKNEMCDEVDSKKCVKCAKAKNPFGYTILERIRNIFAGNRDFEEIKKRKRVLLGAIKYCDLMIAPTKYLFEEFKKWEIPKDKFIYSADGIDDTFLSDIKKTKSKNFRFAFIGAIIPEKGLHILIDAYNKSDIHDSLLYIFGDLNIDEGYAAKIQEKSAKNKRIIFRGTFSPEKIGKVFKDIDCLVMPSVWAENAPLVVKNAILAKTPVIASDIPGVRDNIENGINGLLFKMGDSEELMKQMKKIVKKEEYEKIKNRIRKIKTTKENADELINMYKQLLKNE